MSDRFYFFKGRVALYAILKAMGIKQGDEVILPGFTCVVVPNAIIYLGARPIYVDIDPETYNIAADRIEEKITEKTRAIIAQHTFGIPAEMERINEIARKNNLYVIEDSCHAVGSKYKGTAVGNFGDAAFFSSQWSKPVTTGLGGWAVVNNRELAQTLENIYAEFEEPSLREDILLRSQYFLYSRIVRPPLFWFAQNKYRQLSRLGLLIGSSSNEENECRMPARYKKQMSHWQKRLLQRKIMEIDEMIRHRKLISSLYETCLTDKGMKTVNLPEGYEPVFVRYPLLVEERSAVLREAQKREIEVGDWFFSPVYSILQGWDKVHYEKGMCPVAENICDHIINLPTHQRIDMKEARRTIDFIIQCR